MKNLTFHQLTLAGFKSFKTPQTFYFPKHRGFYFLTGVNEVEPQLSPNASGKTSLWDGLSWTLYGKSARDLKATETANWEDQGMVSGDVEFSINAQYYQLSRTAHPNSLTLIQNKKKKSVTQEQVTELLGLDHGGFLSVVLMGQFNRFFFDLSPAEKLSAFSDILGLEQWLRFSDTAKTEVDLCERVLNSSKELRAGIKATITSTTKQLTTEQQTHHKQDTPKLESSIEKLAKKVRRLGKQQKRAEKEYYEIDRRIHRLSSLAIEQQQVVKKVESQGIEISKQQSATRIKLEHAEQQLKQVRQAKDHCPLCHQPIKPKHLIQEAKGIESAIDALKAREVQLAIEQEGVTEKVKEGNGRLSRYLHRLTLLRMKAEQAKEGSLQSQISALKHRVSDKMDLLDQIKREEARYEQRLESLKGSIELAHQRLGKLNRKIHQYETSHQTHAYWQKEFKYVRLWLIEEALKQLQIEVANSLMQLGLGDWSVTFDVEKVTKQGKISRGFAVLIQSPASGKPVRWENWCGGETQRLRIAGAIGLANLMRYRLGIKPNIEVWDEPTAHLNNDGITDLLTFFEARSRDENRQIWLVDHRSLKAGNFDGEVTVKKTKKGSLILNSRIFKNISQGAGIDDRSKYARGWKRRIIKKG